MANADVVNISDIGMTMEVIGNWTPKAEGPPLLNHNLAIIVFLCVAYITVFLLAVICNSLVLTVIILTPGMRNVTNFFLCNLAVADITVSFGVLPITLVSNMFTEWLLGPFLCRAISYLQGVVVSASVYTLAAIAIERYFAMFYSHRTVIRPDMAPFIIAVIWIVPLLIQLPWVLYQKHTAFQTDKYVRAITICYPKFPSKLLERSFVLGIFIVTYVVPLTFITVCYGLIGIKVWRRKVSGMRGSRADRNIQKQKIRIVRMLIVVAVFFACSWLPIYGIHMRVMFGPSMSWAEQKIVLVLKPIFQWLGAASSCVNPFIYCYFSEQFRKGIMNLLGGSKSCCGKTSPHALTQSTAFTNATPERKHNSEPSPERLLVKTDLIKKEMK